VAGRCYGRPVTTTVRLATGDDAAQLAAALTRSWGATIVVGHGTVYELTALPALVAERAGDLVGALTYQVEGDAFEVVSIDAFGRHQGTGTALLEAAVAEARRRGCGRLWLVTTNDNLDALRFYQRRGLRIVGVSPGAVDEARRLKPEIPDVGAYRIPLHDELTLELRL
jgi:ribosomal protein S18 acetylase RimI-like enzyme